MAYFTCHQYMYFLNLFQFIKELLTQILSKKKQIARQFILTSLANTKNIYKILKIFMKFALHLN